MNMTGIPFNINGTSFWPGTFSLKLMWARGGNQISLPDLYGGYYLGQYEKFLLYFHDWDRLAGVMAEECGIRDPVWFYWVEMYDTFKKQDSNPFLDVFVTYDDALCRLLERAAEISTKADSQGTPIVGLEPLLLALFEFNQIEFCRKLIDCGINREKLLEFNRQ
jgi:hypothetical protein